MMFVEASVGQVYFYILCKWVIIGFGILCVSKIVEEVLSLIRAKMVTMGPCKACKNLEERIKEIEGREV